MTNKLNTSSDTETDNPKETGTPPHKNKKPLLVIIFSIIALLIIGYLLFGIIGKKENANEEAYRFVNNNSAVCTHDFQENQIDCVDIGTNQTQTVDIPNEFKDLTSIQPSHDGTRLLLSLNTDSEKVRYVVTDTNFTNPLDVTVPYEDRGQTNTNPEIIWGNSSNKLIISKQVREENDADFLPEPLVVWDYNVASKEARRIYKNGDNEEVTIKLVGSSDEYLFITQRIHKNWVAEDTDPPADALLAVRLDDGFVRVVNIEQIVKIDTLNKYASGVSVKYDPSSATFYINGQNQMPENEFTNFYAAARLEDSNGLILHELSRLTGQAQFYGITSTKGTLVADWSDETEGFNYSFVASPGEKHESQNVNSDKDNAKFTLASLPSAE